MTGAVRGALCSMLFFLSVSLPMSAQSDDELFGDTAPLVTDNAGGSANTTDGLLKTDGVKIGGDFRLEFGGTGDPEKWGDDNGDYMSSFADASVNLFADARPSADYRFFIKGKLTYSADGNSLYELREAFSDFQPMDGVYVRAGKQTANWGVGYFFSPGNLLDLSVIDPEDPTAERTGPLAVRVQKPVGTANYYTYLLLDDATAGGAMGIAPKAEWVLGSTEVGLGALWKKDAPWAVTASATFPFSALDVFAEATVKGNENKIFIVEDSLSPLGISTQTRSGTLFPLATAGFSWSKNDDQNHFDLSLTAQYYYNGEGYADANLIKDHYASVGALVASGNLGLNDLRERGRHYGAVNLALADIMDSEIGLSLFWMGNLVDQSGKTSLTASWTGLEHVKTSLAYEYGYGAKGSEYAADGPASAITLKVTLTEATF